MSALFTTYTIKVLGIMFDILENRKYSSYKIVFRGSSNQIDTFSITVAM